MSYTFNKREKGLMLLLVLILLLCGYWFGIAQPIQARIDAALTQEAAAQDQILVETVKAQQLQDMRKALEELKDEEITSEIPDYDNLDSVMIQLDAILSLAKDYSLTFSPLEYQSDLVCRPVSMSFTAANYASAKAILQNLYHCMYRCSLDNISVTASGSGDAPADVQKSTVTVSLTATFYERASTPAQPQS